MTQVLCRLLKSPLNILRRPVFRTLTVTKCLQENYEGDGKTTVTILNKEYKHLVMFDTLGNHGFRLNNGIFIMGPVAAFPRTVLQWNVESFEKVSKESLSLFSLLEPKLDLLIFGTGDKAVQLDPDLRSFLKSHKISTEVLPTEKALTTFNFLNAEGRCIAGAFFPPSAIMLYEEEMQLLDTAEEINPFNA
uniref:NADH dehydrogenase [ubiquinone] 1 alpha subcomplex assembly factor 3 n=1 Tax=Parasteatoda tepidariorum TaxID=114398 RepID=A0A2L2YEI8_PARTP